ncbi:MAG: hypothetical protein ABIR78_08540 [Ferruginibacter sp.]
MLKRTIKFIVYCVYILFSGCAEGLQEPSALEIQHTRDSASEARIDSAYAAIRSACDTMMVYQVPVMVDSFLIDTSLVQTFFNTTQVYSDADKKVEKVIRQLQADCDSNLLKETYRRAQLRQRSKPMRRKKLKA